MSKLSDYISNRNFPIVRTGISNSDSEIKDYYRKEHNIHYTCSLCDCDIPPTDFLNTETQRGYTVPRDGFFGVRHEYEVLGFVCKTCEDQINEYDNLYYG